MYAYKFVNWEVPPKPDTEITGLLEKAQDGEPLTRTEKDRIANVLYGIGGNHSATYKLHGWAWPMQNYFPRILVSFTYEPDKFKTYYAPDKTSLRKALFLPINEMIYA